ncbi:MAG: hypothetical protein VKK04_05065 [Synechococcales bacterium]|nr:hypothetical protein [Synechococcales bacterium]
MGKKRIAQLLEGLKENHQQDLQNAAAIYSVAQVAVNELERQAVEGEGVDGQEGRRAIAPLPAATAPFPLPDPVSISKAELLEHYGSYNGCRKAAREQGIKFRKNPSWAQLEAGFSYAEAVRQLVRHYLASQPHPNLRNIAVEVSLGE